MSLSSSNKNLSSHYPFLTELVGGHKYCRTRQALSLLEKELGNSPLEKGDKGGCEAQVEKEARKQPPTPPFLRGNISIALRCLPWRRGDGFTLLEILVAVSILSIVLMAVYSTFFLSERAIDGMDESVLKLQESRKAIDILRCELDSAYYDGQDASAFLRIQDRDFYGRQASQLSFTAFSTLRPGLSKVSYYVEDKDGKLDLLKKIESPNAKEETEGVEIIEDLEGFTIEAKYNDTWVKTWDTDVNKEKPEEIRIGLTVLLKGKKVTLSDVSRPRIGRSM